MDSFITWSLFTDQIKIIQCIFILHNNDMLQEMNLQISVWTIGEVISVFVFIIGFCVLKSDLTQMYMYTYTSKSITLTLSLWNPCGQVESDWLLIQPQFHRLNAADDPLGVLRVHPGCQTRPRSLHPTRECDRSAWPSTNGERWPARWRSGRPPVGWVSRCVSVWVSVWVIGRVGVGEREWTAGFAWVIESVSR